MKIKFQESENSINITLEPETTQEFSQLLRFVRNAKAQKPSISLSFNNEPYCNIHMRKVARNLQNNFIKPGLK